MTDIYQGPLWRATVCKKASLDAGFSSSISIETLIYYYNPKGSWCPPLASVSTAHAHTTCMHKYTTPIYITVDQSVPAWEHMAFVFQCLGGWSRRISVIFFFKASQVYILSSRWARATESISLKIKRNKFKTIKQKEQESVMQQGSE